MADRYRRRGPLVDAARWTGANVAELEAFAGNLFMTIHPLDRGEDPDQTAQVFDEDHNEWALPADGDWIIRDEHGHYRPVRADLFADHYEQLVDAVHTAGRDRHDEIAHLIDQSRQRLTAHLDWLLDRHDNGEAPGWAKAVQALRDVAQRT